MLRHLLRLVLCGCVALALLGTSAFFTDTEMQKGKKKAQQRPRPGALPQGPVVMAADQVGLEITFGIKDKAQTNWNGEVQVSPGKVAGIELGQGGVKATVNSPRFNVLHRKQAQNLLPPIIRVTLDAPANATVTINVGQGTISFALADVKDNPVPFMDGQVTVERLEPAVRLTGPATEDDFPTMVAGADGSLWMAYVEYTPGLPLVMERLFNREFDSLVQTGHGDRIRLRRFDGKTFHPAEDVTDGGLDVWRPTIAMNGQGELCIAWSQKVEDDWEILYRCGKPGAKPGEATTWQEPVRLTHEHGSDFHVVSTTDSKGNIWLAWQGWRKTNFDIFVAALSGDAEWKTPRKVSTSEANDWSPSLAADRQGNVYLAWDTYEKGNYDVLLRRLGEKPGEWRVAETARFEARPSIVCDKEDRVWIAYEEGDEQWGKDYANEGQFKRVGLKNNPGFSLYTHRTIRVKCLADDRIVQPAGSLAAVFSATRGRNKSLPRLAFDRAGGLWLLFRQHPLALGTGEVWNTFATRYDGKTWSTPRRLSQSANLLDNRPAIAASGHGVMVVYSSDHRLRTQNRDQDDLYACQLADAGPVQKPELVADESTADRVAVVHPTETADVARMRDFRVTVGGQKLQIVRGEFHRHTEYTSHRDQDGTLEDSWRYGLDASRMDWMGNGDHDNGFGHEYMWWQIQKITDLYHNPPYFTAAQTYERSVVYPNGHRNVMMPRRGIRPLPRGGLPGTPDKGTPDTKLLYAYLKHFGGICASHTSATNMGTDWRDNDPEVEPVVEVYQGHRHNYEHFGAPRSPTAATQIGGYEPAGFIWNALEKGYRLGFESSSDHVSTHMSYSMVFVTENSRQAIIDGFKARHSYGATDNILLVVGSGDHLMGDIFQTTRRPTLQIQAQGTLPIIKIHVIRDNKYVYTSEPKNPVANLAYTDMDAKPGQTSYYYVRLEQADGNLAWASPMWITYQP